MITFSLSPQERVGLSFDGHVGEHPGGLLERGRREEALGLQRRLGNAQGARATPRRARPPSAIDLGVGLLEFELIHPGTGQQVGVARILHLHLPQHLADDDLDVLVVDVHALGAVTSWTSWTRYICTPRTPLTRRMSWGFTDPSVSRSPAVTSWPSFTLRRAPYGMLYTRSSPSAVVTTTLRLPLLSTIETTPSTSVMMACPLGLRPQRAPPPWEDPP